MRSGIRKPCCSPCWKPLPTGNPLHAIPSGPHRPRNLSQSMPQLHCEVLVAWLVAGSPLASMADQPTVGSRCSRFSRFRRDLCLIMSGKGGRPPNPGVAGPAHSYCPGQYGPSWAPRRPRAWQARLSQASPAGASWSPPILLLSMSHWNPNWVIYKCAGCGRPFIGPGSVFNPDVERVRQCCLPVPPCRLCKKHLSASGAERHRAMFGYPGPEATVAPSGE